ncbi:MAG TPA: hypothetical protein VHP11_15560 [Tepidisphaeraceae bacterium]|nr:hypothetical protein [Tepidisphaeraceae bacterium]
MHPRLFAILLIALVTLMTGCAGSAVSSGHNTALDSVDLVSMTDDMAMKIVGSPAVQQELARNGKLRVVVQPVENHMVAEVLPRGAAEAFTGRLRALLSERAPDKFTWIMNRDDFYRLRSRELDFALGPSPDSIQPEYALVARFRSLTDEDASHRSSYYLCVYELTNIQNRQSLWTDKYEVKKTAVKGFMD